MEKTSLLQVPLQVHLSCYYLHMLQLSSHIILWDTEYTSWEGAQERQWSGPNEYKELVQIGAILFNTQTYTEENSLLLFIRPTKNPVLSDYFCNLTHITQHDIDTRGVDFQTAAHTFKEWIKEYPCYAYGKDKAVLDTNFVLNNLENTFDDSCFFDVRDLFNAAGIDSSRYMSSTITEAFGVVSPHRGHDALNDARTIGEGLRALCTNVPIVPEALFKPL